MVTASMPFSLSSIWRKSLYCFALGYFWNVSAAFFQSGSHKATMFSALQPSMSEAPFPPAPIAAMLSFSLGDLYPKRLRDDLRARASPAASSTVLLTKNVRRDTFLFVIGFPSPL